MDDTTVEIEKKLKLLLGGKSKSDDDRKGPTQSEILLEIVEGVPLMHTAKGTVYAELDVDDHRETCAVRSKNFKQFLGLKFYESEGKAPASEAINSSLNVIEGRGLFQCPEVEVNTRIAAHDDKIHVDLANSKWESIEISADGWQVVTDSPAMFRRSSGMLPMPYPSQNGDIKPLLSLLNVDEGDGWRLVVAWLVQAFNPVGPYPILTFQGEQGTAKSTTARILRSVIDPNSSPLRSTPRNERDLSISGSNSWVLSYDNLSRVQPWLSDALCRMSTGGGFSTRELFSDRDEVLFTAMRPIIVNGIADVVTRHDLADRALFIGLDPIPDTARIPEKELLIEFDRLAPVILGGLLDAVSTALRNIKHTHIAELPRMADFALWVQAAEPALPWAPGGFLDVYQANRESIIRDAVESNVVGAAISEWIAGREDPRWVGTAAELLAELNTQVGEKAMKAEKWPKDVRAIGKRIKVISSFLRKVGIDIEYLPRSGRQRLIAVSRV